MAIMQPKPQESGTGKILGMAKTVGGIVTGNPALIAAGMAGNTPIGRAAGLYSAGSGMADMFKGGGDVPGASGMQPGGPRLGVNTDLGYGMDAMRRKFGQYGFGG